MISKIKYILRRSNTLHFFTVIILLSVFTSFSNYFRVPVAGTADFIKYSVHFLILTSSVIGILNLITIQRWIFVFLAPPLLFLFVTTASSLYFFNITITSEIIEVILKTDWSVSKEFISVQLVILLLATLSIIFSIARWRLKVGNIPKRQVIYITTLSVVMIIPSIVLNKKRHNTIMSRVPYSMISASKDYTSALKMSRLERKTIANDAVYMGNDSLTVILVLGESLRKDHLGINGYKRNTTPLLSQRKIYSFKQNKSLYTYTAASIPQILTRADSTHPERAFTEESVLTVFERVGFKTIWLANQVPDYTYSSLAKSCDEYINLSAKSNTYSDVISTDQNILDKISNYQNSNKNLLILHTIGSHWYYNYRCPEFMRQFFPITKSRSFSNNSKNQMINSYDNSIYFTDYFIDQVIQKFEKENTILIYISDHGETLGEEGKWLHAFEHETLHDAACFIWMSKKYKEKHPHSVAIKENTKKKTNTSSIFHTLIHAADIQGSFTTHKKSLLSSRYASDN